MSFGTDALFGTRRRSRCGEHPKVRLNGSHGACTEQRRMALPVVDGILAEGLCKLPLATRASRARWRRRLVRVDQPRPGPVNFDRERPCCSQLLERHKGPLRRPSHAIGPRSLSRCRRKQSSVSHHQRRQFGQCRVRQDWKRQVTTSSGLPMAAGMLRSAAPGTAGRIREEIALGRRKPVCPIPFQPDTDSGA